MQFMHSSQQTMTETITLQTYRKTISQVDTSTYQGMRYWRQTKGSGLQRELTKHAISLLNCPSGQLIPRVTVSNCNREWWLENISPDHWWAWGNRLAMVQVQQPVSLKAHNTSENRKGCGNGLIIIFSRTLLSLTLAPWEHVNQLICLIKFCGSSFNS